MCSLALSQDESLLVTGAADNELRVWALGREEGVMAGNEATAGVSCDLVGSIRRQSRERALTVKFSPDFRLLMCQGADKMLEVYVGKLQRLPRLHAHIRHHRCGPPMQAILNCWRTHVVPGAMCDISVTSIYAPAASTDLRHSTTYLGCRVCLAHPLLSLCMCISCLPRDPPPL